MSYLKYIHISVLATTNSNFSSLLLPRLGDDNHDATSVEMPCYALYSWKPTSCSWQPTFPFIFIILIPDDSTYWNFILS